MRDITSDFLMLIYIASDSPTLCVPVTLVLINVCFFQASMLSQPDGPFINIAKLNLSKYAQRQNLAKVHVQFKKF